MRRWRQSRGLTLAQVGERSGLNVGYLSQIENEKAVPSLDALATIAARPRRAGRVAPAGLRGPAARSSGPASGPTAGEGGVRIEEVDAGTSRDVCILEAVAEPGHATGVHAHHGDEHHVVLAGRWRMTQGEHTYELGPGDYLAWDPTVPHDVEVIGDEPGRPARDLPAPDAAHGSRRRGPGVSGARRRSRSSVLVTGATGSGRAGASPAGSPRTARGSPSTARTAAGSRR